MDNERGWVEQEKEGDVRETERARETVSKGGGGTTHKDVQSFQHAGRSTYLSTKMIFLPQVFGIITKVYAQLLS